MKYPELWQNDTVVRDLPRELWPALTKIREATLSVGSDRTMSCTVFAASFTNIEALMKGDDRLVPWGDIAYRSIRESHSRRSTPHHIDCPFLTK